MPNAAKTALAIVFVKRHRLRKFLAQPYGFGALGPERNEKRLRAKVEFLRRGLRAPSRMSGIAM